MRGAISLALWIAALALPGCGAEQPLPALSPRDALEARTSLATAEESRDWAAVTRSPWAVARAPASGSDPRDARMCSTPDAALERVAEDLAKRRARGHVDDADAVTLLLRRAGEPHVRPHVLVASGRAPLDERSLRALRAKLGSAEPAGLSSRCGVAFVKTAQGSELAVAVSVAILADLSPLPVRARTGEWLSFEARIHVAARSAKLVVLGPRGLPRTVPTSLDPVSGLVRARFALDRPGAFTVQLVGDLDEGPRPLLEARVFSDVAPPADDEQAPAPGEDAGAGTDDDALARMISALRSAEALPPLSRDEHLDAVARHHAERMRNEQAVAHDLGDGDPMARFEESSGALAGAAAGPVKAIGENVAHAASVALAHRALHASPSHRLNLLRADYTHVGVSVATAPDGSVYVCEVFASR